MNRGPTDGTASTSAPSRRGDAGAPDTGDEPASPVAPGPGDPAAGADEDVPDKQLQRWRGEGGRVLADE